MFANVFLTFAAGRSLEVLADGTKAAEQNDGAQGRELFQPRYRGSASGFLCFAVFQEQYALKWGAPLPCYQVLTILENREGVLE